MAETYEEQAARLAAIEDDDRFRVAVRQDWNHARGLFAFAGDTARIDTGCLTMIRSADPGDNYIAETPELTEAIRADDRLPRDSGTITRESLPVFVEWQRRMDPGGDFAWRNHPAYVW